MSDLSNRGPADVRTDVRAVLDDLSAGRVDMADAERLMEAARQAVAIKGQQTGATLTPEKAIPPLSPGKASPKMADKVADKKGHK